MEGVVVYVYAYYAGQSSSLRRVSLPSRSSGDRTVRREREEGNGNVFFFALGKCRKRRREEK